MKDGNTPYHLAHLYASARACTELEAAARERGLTEEMQLGLNASGLRPTDMQPSRLSVAWGALQRGASGARVPAKLVRRSSLTLVPCAAVYALLLAHFHVASLVALYVVGMSDTDWLHLGFLLFFLGMVIKRRIKT